VGFAHGESHVLIAVVAVPNVGNRCGH
jgi:hypothetical protein